MNKTYLVIMRARLYAFAAGCVYLLAMLVYAMVTANQTATLALLMALVPPALFYVIVQTLGLSLPRSPYRIENVRTAAVDLIVTLGFIFMCGFVGYSIITAEIVSLSTVALISGLLSFLLIVLTFNPYL